MINLDSSGDKVYVDNLVIKLKQNLDFIPDNEDKITVGRVDAFKNVYVDPFDHSKGIESVWMLLTEIENAKNKRWTSVYVWYDQYLKGLFTNQKTPEVIHDNTQPADDDLPF